MKVVYHCFGGAHSSVVTAAIHLGLLPADRVPGRCELLAVDRFDHTESNDIGVPYLMGTDEDGNEVFVMGTGGAKQICLKLVSDMLEYAGMPPSELLFVPTLKYVGFYTRVGGYLSRGIGFPRFGRPLVVFGIRRTYEHFVRTALECRERICQRKPPGGNEPASD